MSAHPEGPGVANGALILESERGVSREIVQNEPDALTWGSIAAAAGTANTAEDELTKFELGGPMSQGSVDFFGTHRNTPVYLL